MTANQNHGLNPTDNSTASGIGLFSGLQLYVLDLFGRPSAWYQRGQETYTHMSPPQSCTACKHGISKVIIINIRSAKLTCDISSAILRNDVHIWEMSFEIIDGKIYVWKKKYDLGWALCLLIA